MINPIDNKKNIKNNINNKGSSSLKKYFSKKNNILQKQDLSNENIININDSLPTTTTTTTTTTTDYPSIQVILYIMIQCIYHIS